MMVPNRETDEKNRQMQKACDGKEISHDPHLVYVWAQL